ncbi:hypothetical protein [Photorhabdus hindustanensis]|uniref:hypothetical protein n=1 Tax=Photorhabdus hindustanensis TaxID=2918802 RepID=UPI0015E2B001|nr:hypothetical protein [Photorhabdus hindustanensis]
MDEDISYYGYDLYENIFLNYTNWFIRSGLIELNEFYCHLIKLFSEIIYAGICGNFLGRLMEIFSPFPRNNAGLANNYLKNLYLVL